MAVTFMIVFMICLWSILNLVGQASENIGFVHWFTALGPDKDVYWVLFATGVAYFAVFFPIYIVAWCVFKHYRGTIGSTAQTLISKNSNNPNDEKFFPSKRRWFIGFFLTGLSNALNGYLIIYTSDSHRTPPLIQQCLSNGGLIFTILANMFILKYKFRRYANRFAIAGFATVLVGCIIGLIPVMLTSKFGDHSWDEFGYSLIFLTGSFVGCVYNVYQRKYLDKFLDENLANHPQAGVRRSYKIFIRLQLLTLQTFGLVVFYIVGFWTDFIPWFGSTSPSSEFLRKGSLIMETTFLPWKWKEINWAGATAALANGGYIMSFWAALLLNEFATGFTALANLVVPIVCTFFFKLVPGLNDSDIKIGYEYLIPSLVLGLTGGVLWFIYEYRQKKQDEIEKKQQKVKSAIVNDVVIDGEN
jgi:hypothetical protein